jgi:hypothetical protein
MQSSDDSSSHGNQIFTVRLTCDYDTQLLQNKFNGCVGAYEAQNSYVNSAFHTK